MTIDQTTLLARSTAEGEAEYQVLISSLRQIWLDLEPIPGQPYVTSPDWRGQVGVCVTGRGDWHGETGTYRTYRVLGWPWLPLVFLGAYRVCEGPVGNLVFIGRHPLPSWARAWNTVGILLATGLAGVWVYPLARLFMKAAG